MTQSIGNKTKSFFDLLNKIFVGSDIQSNFNQIREPAELARWISDMIMQRKIMELSARDEDVPLQGLFSFLKNILKKFPDVRENLF
jgi:hypothetical protein